MAATTLEADFSQVSSSGTFILRSLLEGISLSDDDDGDVSISITCVEYWEGNLYIGTSGGKVLHFVLVPQDDPSASTIPSFIFASKLSPTEGSTARSITDTKGIQEILLLPRVKKVCILNGRTLSFYSLPELSPALGNTIVSNCTWVGGLDLHCEEDKVIEGETVMVCIQKRVRLVRIREEARLVKNIEFPNCLASVRRGGVACVADDSSYALLDLENQRKITLFSISSLDAIAATGSFEDISQHPESSAGRPLSGVFNRNHRGHGKNASLGSFVGQISRRQASPRPRSPDPSTIDPELSGRADSPGAVSRRDRAYSVPNSSDIQTEKPLPSTPELNSDQRTSSATPNSRHDHLQPLICSPTTSEFLLATGTGRDDAGVGIFVNLDGEVVRGTLQFHRYPTSLVIDKRIAAQPVQGHTSASARNDLVFASVGLDKQQDHHIIQIQRWDVEDPRSNEWLRIPSHPPYKMTESDTLSPHHDCDVRSVKQAIDWSFQEVSAMLRGSRLRLHAIESNIVEDKSPDWELRRLREEQQFGERFGHSSSSLIVWSLNSIWLVLKHPVAMRFDTALNAALYSSSDEAPVVDRTAVLSVIRTIQDTEYTDETEFLSMDYIRQKSSFILFADLIYHASDAAKISESEHQLIESLMVEGNVDPRIILSLIPLFSDDIFEGPEGIWIHSGLLEIVEEYRRSLSVSNTNSKDLSAGVLEILRKFLQTLRQRKGFGSVTSETEVFQSVDASLLHLLLERDRLPRSGPNPWTNRSELYAFVDSGVDCFERALQLLEQYDRLYVLSRLYGTRKLPGKVLEIWRKIVEGIGDPGGEFQDGENEIRRYLGRVRDRNLVEEYGIWLARRNPSLGVQVFSEDQSRIKLEPQETIDLLRSEAPESVKYYLEHLVFGKKQTHYADRLISYYLDSVITVLENEASARDILSQTYQAYRALRPPTPTYRQFLMDNPAPFPWWSDRLRLLELLGGSHGDNFDYNIAHILKRMESFKQYLVPESIILDGRQGKHQEALRLLIHGLGDYHTAVNYCLLGGASIYHPVSGSLVNTATQNREDQIVLFNYLLTEFLAIQDLSDRIERTSELLSRFGSWYDPRDVLTRIPDTWSVETVSGFLISTFRRLVTEKNEATIVKALSGAENLQIAAKLVEKCTSAAPEIEEIA